MTNKVYRYCLLLLTLCCWKSIVISQATSIDKPKVDIEISLHNGRTYYNAYSLLTSYLENEDYRSRGTTEFNTYTHTVSLGLWKELNARNGIRFSLGYNSLGTGLSGRIGSLRSDVNRPLSDDIPVSMEGQLNHYFIKLGVAISHSFGSGKEGFYFLTGIDYNLNIGNNWRMLVYYETGRSAIDKDLSAFSRVNVNNPFVANFQLGYNIPIGNKGVFLSPFYQLYLSLVKIHENGNSSFGGESFGIRIKR